MKSPIPKTRRNALPNPEVVRDLYDRYHKGNHVPDAHVSSHWREYGQKIRLRLDQDGHPIEAIGYGFGDLQIHRVPYRVLSLMSMISQVIGSPDRGSLMRLMVAGWNVCRRSGLAFAQDAFRQVCSLAVIERHLSRKSRDERLAVLMIGDGYGFLASLFKERFPSSTIVLVDLGNILTFQSYYSQRAHPDKLHKVVSRGSGSDFPGVDFVYCPTELLARISDFSFDLAINIASMQEMTRDSVAMYFQFLRQRMAPDGLFYCCNRERKVLVGGEISDYREYAWHPKDVHLVDERCPWHKYYASFTTTANGPTVLGMRVPFVNYYDGPTWHRLSRLHTVG